MTVPIEMPDLIAGTGEYPNSGGCVMQAAAWLASGGKEWNDSPACVHSTLRHVAIKINDNVGDQVRQRLWPLIPRLLGTASGDRKTDARIAVQLAVWAAEKVLPIIKDPELAKRAEGRLGAAKAWLDTGEKSDADAAADAATVYAAAAAADAADAAYAYAANAAAAAVYAATAAAAAADADATATATAATTAAERKISFFVELLDEYDRITGHIPEEIDEARWMALRDAILAEQHA